MINRNAAILECLLTITVLVGSTAASDTKISIRHQQIGLSTEFTGKQRRSIWEERVQAEQRARKDACAKYPNRYSLVDTLPVGTIIHLFDTTYLMPEYDPKDISAAIAKRGAVLPGATAIVIGVAVSKGGTLWYETEILEYPLRIDGTTDKGWVIASALMRQMPVENFWKSLDLEDSLRQVYIQELLHQYNISKLQLESISWEAEREQWQLPEVE